MHIPDSAIKYLLMQRTGLQRWNPKQIRGLRRLPVDYESLILPLEASVRRAAIKNEFAAGIDADYRSMCDHLPENAQSILDIGCGIAGIELPLYDHYPQKPDLYLLDRTETAKAGFEYGMGGKYRFYNSLELARQFLIGNGVQPSKIHLLDAQPGFQFQASHRFDLVVSLISWGYHYPLDVYLDQVYEHMNPGGRLILDIRKGYGSEDQLRKRFGNLKALTESPKEMRCMTIK